MIDTKVRCAAVAVFCVVSVIHQAPAAEASPCRIQAFGDSITSGIRIYSVDHHTGFKVNHMGATGIQTMMDIG